MDSDSPVKDLLYERLTLISEEKIQHEISNKNTSKIIQEIEANCHSKLLQISGDEDENFGIFAESLMHYLITLSLIPSQRKISKENLDLDIIIPDLKTLMKKPEDSLIICFPKSRNLETVKEIVSKVKNLVPQQNIWVVLHTDLSISERKYIIGRGQESFSRIIQDILEFLSKRKQSKFKIFKN